MSWRTKIQVVAVRRKPQTDIGCRRRSYDLGVAVGWDVAQPQASLVVVYEDAQDVFAVRRDGNAAAFASFGNLADGKILKGRGARAG
jgi:hypothetical protein